MFTGIVEEIGKVESVEHVDGAVRLHVRAPVVNDDVKHGDSLAVDGVCLTVTDVKADEVVLDVMPETLRRTTLAALAPGTPVNLERAATLSTRLGGHLVQGHVDETGHIAARRDGPRWTDVRIEVPAALLRYIVEKGSVAVDGTSLTVVDVDDTSFSVSLIPTTLERTTLGSKQAGDVVNVEVDIVGKYVEKFLGSGHRPATGTLETS